MDSNLSRKIISAARSQQRELEEGSTSSQPVRDKINVKFSEMDTDEESDNEIDDNVSDGDAFYENIEINEEDERAINMFMSKNPLPSRTLADIIMEKITEKQTELDTHFTDAGSLQVGYYNKISNFEKKIRCLL